MKREILFRGKSIDNGEWIEGSLLVLNNPCNNYKIFPQNSSSIHDSLAVDPITVSQFTGLIDKNGKKIFENDVVHHGDSSELCFVAYKEAGFYCVPASKERHVLPLEMWVSSCVVIGNIFDNPELAAKS